MIEPALQVFRHGGEPVFKVKGNDEDGENDEHERPHQLVVKYRDARFIPAACKTDNAAARNVGSKQGQANQRPGKRPIGKKKIIRCLMGLCFTQPPPAYKKQVNDDDCCIEWGQ